MLKNITVYHYKPAEVWGKAVDFLVNRIRLNHNMSIKTLILLSGGSAVNLYRDLGAFIEKNDLDPKLLTFAQVDERYQPESGRDINANNIKETGLWKICDEKKISYHLISQRESFTDSIDGYNAILESLFRMTYKLAVLGVGADGHTAGLLPGSEKKWNKKLFVTGYENNGEYKKRISVTPKTIGLLDQVFVVANGVEKKEALTNLVKGKKKGKWDEFPAGIIALVPNINLFTDQRII